jgi:AcrR family transcriptional regulator
VRSAAAPDHDTRGRLVEAAGRLFGDRGFDAVTVRDICQLAQANVAAINYHFGDKMGLYREVLETAIATLQQLTAHLIEAGRGQPAEARLRSYVHLLIERLANNQQAWIRPLLMRETAHPTPHLDQIVEQGLRPRVEYLAGIVAELLDSSPADPRALACAASIHGQCLIAGQKAVASRLARGAITTASLASFAEHVVTFSLGGIRATRNRPHEAPRGRAPRRSVK